MDDKMHFMSEMCIEDKLQSEVRYAKIFKVENTIDSFDIGYLDLFDL